MYMLCFKWSLKFGSGEIICPFPSSFFLLPVLAACMMKSVCIWYDGFHGKNVSNVFVV